MHDVQSILLEYFLRCTIIRLCIRVEFGPHCILSSHHKLNEGVLFPQNI